MGCNAVEYLLRRRQATLTLSFNAGPSRTLWLLRQEVQPGIHDRPRKSIVALSCVVNRPDRANRMEEYIYSEFCSALR